MKKEITIAIIGSIVGAVFTFVAASSLGVFEKTVSDSQIKDIAKLIEMITLLIDHHYWQR